MESKEGLNSELESFRQQWLTDLHAKRKTDEPTRETHRETPLAPTETRPQLHREPTAPSFSSGGRLHVDDEEGYVGHSFDEPPATDGHTLDDASSAPPPKELVSALDHYEEAMHKEGQGNMGDSLSLYRRAYRLDHRVDKTYREKHFPGGVKAPFPSAQPGPSSSAAPVQNTTGEAEASVPLSIDDLISGFSGLKIEPAPPEIEGTPALPSPISDLPDELLIHILQDVAIEDVGDFARLAVVCKHFAYLVATEQRIWRRVCLGSEVGFGAMHYHYQRTVEWDPLNEIEQTDDGTIVSSRELADRRRGESLLVTRALCPSVYPTWKTMFRSRPRIRFNGCYISTVNYVRTGQASTYQATWGSPILIVTYYRYLRFFRDGSCISLLTTHEPGDVVHHLTRDLLQQHAGNVQSHLPSSVMRNALKGRWRLSSSALEDSDHKDEAAEELQEGDVYIETQGVGPKYTYSMELSLRSAGKRAARNNKIEWRSFYSYNNLTDDWAEFGQKNYKPFFFSRVKSYGIGE